MFSSIIRRVLLACALFMLTTTVSLQAAHTDQTARLRQASIEMRGLIRKLTPAIATGGDVAIPIHPVRRTKDVAPTVSRTSPVTVTAAEVSSTADEDLAIALAKHRENAALISWLDAQIIEFIPVETRTEHQKLCVQLNKAEMAEEYADAIMNLKLSYKSIQDQLLLGMPTEQDTIVAAIHLSMVRARNKYSDPSLIDEMHSITTKFHVIVSTLPAVLIAGEPTNLQYQIRPRLRMLIASKTPEEVTANMKELATLYATLAGTYADQNPTYHEWAKMAANTTYYYLISKYQPAL